MPEFRTPGFMGSERQKLFMDLRQDLNELFHGDGVVNGFSFTVILRKVDKTQHAPGFDPLKRETSRDEATGNKVWITYDKLVKTVKRKYVGKETQTDVGQLETDTTLFFFEYDIQVAEEDTIIEIATDDLGNPSSPVKYVKKYSIKDVELVRGNNGRVEFVQVYAAKSE